MYSKIAVAATLVASAFGAHPAPYHPAPAPYHAPAPAPYHAPAYKAPHHAPAAYDESPKPFAFQYGVADDYSGARFNAAETTDGKTLTGSYSVNLPDGRIQTVTYTSDPYGYGGHVAEVTYSENQNTQNISQLTNQLQHTNQPQFISQPQRQF